MAHQQLAHYIGGIRVQCAQCGGLDGDPDVGSVRQELIRHFSPKSSCNGYASYRTVLLMSGHVPLGLNADGRCGDASGGGPQSPGSAFGYPLCRAPAQRDSNGPARSRTARGCDEPVDTRGGSADRISNIEQGILNFEGTHFVILHSFLSALSALSLLSPLSHLSHLSNLVRDHSRSFELIRHGLEAGDSHPHRRVGGEEIGQKALLVGDPAAERVCDA